MRRKRLVYPIRRKYDNDPAVAIMLLTIFWAILLCCYTCTSSVIRKSHDAYPGGGFGDKCSQSVPVPLPDYEDFEDSLNPVAPRATPETE